MQGSDIDGRVLWLEKGRLQSTEVLERNKDFHSVVSLESFLFPLIPNMYSTSNVTEQVVILLFKHSIIIPSDRSLRPRPCLCLSGGSPTREGVPFLQHPLSHVQ